MRRAITINGTPSPKEYTPRSPIPADKVSTLLAMSNTEVSIGPIHGVQPKLNPMPMSMDVINDGALLFVSADAFRGLKMVYLQIQHGRVQIIIRMPLIFRIMY